jgi:hypothetical protein
MMLTHDDVSPFTLTNSLYIWSLAYAILAVAKEDSICRGDVWETVGLTLAASFLVALIAHGYVASMHQHNVQSLLTHISGMITYVAYPILFFRLMARDPNIFIDKTNVQDVHTAYKRFVEDLDEKCQPPPRYWFWSPPSHPYYLRLRRIVCNRDAEVAEEVMENYPLIAAAYDLVLYRRDLELAQRLMEILRNRSLDEKERAAFQVLEVAYKAAANPPCGDQEALRRYAEKLNSIHTPGWSFLLKILTQIHLGYADPKHVAVIKRGILRTIERCSGDNLSIYYFALSAIDRIKPLCQNTQ